MSTEYKVGDKVRIIKRTEHESEYRFMFTDEMAAREGKIYKISYKSSIPYDGEQSVPDDGYLYKLEDDERYNWASSMFEPVQEETPPPSSKEEPKVLDFIPKKKHYQLNFSV